MKSVYLIDLNNGEHVLFTEEKVLINQYAESGHEYDAFENGMNAIAEAADVSIVEVSMNQNDCEVVSEMFLEVCVSGSTKPIVEYIRAHAVKR